ncbi:hypothetical protein [Corynebacterium lipophiloflavum]|uniref:Uncharacterized protein n=1 Tax=Corynebacterium lipophiloflavum (strain ATCC 700352 / DSM 44291 / CCUG 37336 / JCM 10383 / DMMZ 1944) TaxID=525263 RepID=C0XTG0_CORLD|nr:hypothetical protein [Corynebacterium lipophiloflavum]EEI16457.1 hypothetical protein HMPREF0298_1730 [Corynebacterium lipophiloflavum DSM 44291]
MKLYVRLAYHVPELGGELLTVAELEEVSAAQCTMLRMIEFDSAESITGVYVDGRVIGRANTPMEIVAHPDTYAAYEGVSSTRITQPEFEGLWQEALQKFQA